MVELTAPVRRYLLWIGTFIALWLAIGLPLGLLYKDPKAATTTLTSTQAHFLRVLVVIPASLSVAGFVVICILYYRSKKRTLYQRLIIYRGLAQALLGIVMFFSPTLLDIHGWCSFQTFSAGYLVLVGSMWVLVFSFVQYQAIICGVVLQDLAKLEWMYHLFCWGAPFPLGVAILSIGNMPVVVGGWCWLSSRFTAWRWMWLYLPATMVLICIIGMVVIIIMHARRQFNKIKNMPNACEQKIARKMALMSLRLLWYLTSYFLTWIWGISYRFWNLIDPEPVYIWVCFSTFFLPSGGFLNTLAYTLCFQIRKRKGNQQGNRRQIVQTEAQEVA